MLCNFYCNQEIVGIYVPHVYICQCTVSSKQCHSYHAVDVPSLIPYLGSLGWGLSDCQGKEMHFPTSSFIEGAV